MSRTKTNSGVEQHIVVETPLNSAAVDELNRNQLAINQQFGLEPFSQERVETEIAFFLVQVEHSFWEAGTRLIQLKENLQHGDFLKSLVRIDIEERTARRLMKVALKYSNRTALSNLTKATISKSKLLELAILDDDDLQELNDGGSVAGITLDDVECMSVRELKAALRKTRTDAADAMKIKESIINAKDKKINEIDEKLTAIRIAKDNEPKPAPVFKPIGTDELIALQKVTNDIYAAIGAELCFKINDLFQAFGGDIPLPMRLAAAQSIGLLITTIDGVSEQFSIVPEFDVEHAVQNPVKATVQAFQAWQANGGIHEITPEIAEFNARHGITPKVYSQVDVGDIIEHEGSVGNAHPTE